MRVFAIAVCLSWFLLISHVRGQQIVSNALSAAGPQPVPSVLYSPDRQHYVAWFDTDLGLPLGEVRSVMFRSAKNPEDTFSFVTTPGHTHAVWNSASTRCVIGDQPNMGEVHVWLIYSEEPNKWLWQKLNPSAPVYAAYRSAMGDKDIPLFRPYLDKIEWISDTQTRFLIWCNVNDPKLAVSGHYFVTIDTQKPDEVPKMTKAPRK